MIRELSINNYEIFVVIGNNDDEKLVKQRIIINIKLRFPRGNDACYDDCLDHAVCYSQLIDFLNKELKDAQFNLIEKAAQFLYEKISGYLNNETILKYVEVTKPSIIIDNLESASFICADW